MQLRTIHSGCDSRRSRNTGHQHNGPTRHMRSAFIQPPCKRQQLLIAANTTGSNHALPPGRSCHGRSSHDAQLHSVRAVVLLSRTSSRLQRQSNSTPPRALMNTDVAHGDALWALDARAAMLDLNTDAFRTVIESSQDNAWMAACEPERLFALREVCTLLGVDVPTALELVQQEPRLLDVPCRTLEENAEGVQALLQLPRASLLQLLSRAPSLLLEGPAVIESQQQRIARELGLSLSDGDAAMASRLLRLVTCLGPGALVDWRVAVQKVQPLISSLAASPADVLALLHAELLLRRRAGVADLLFSPDRVDSLCRDWRALSEEAQLPSSEVIAALAAQLRRPDARYLLVDSTQLLRSDITALQAECQLDTATVCRMLLAAPRLALVPASFWHLLLQYMLFLVPHWRQQLEQLPPAEAGLLLAALFDECGADVVDEVAVRPRDALFTTADSDYNSELQVLEALLDQGMHAPTFVAPGLIAAGRVWRLIFLCNPRLAPCSAQPQQQQQQQTQNNITNSSSSSSSNSSSSSPWASVFSLQLPVPLVNQMQQQGELALRGDRNSTAASSPRLSLRDVVSADTAEFCANHPEYGHWLHNAAFELEWANSKAVAPVATWDP